MKLISFACPGCGAQLNVDVGLKQATCPYCGNAFAIDDEVQHVKLDDAEQAGYEFERGRQKAQAEYAQAEPPKKRRTWLWVLGWIFIFPVPLTILMLRTDKLDKKVCYGIIAAAWIVYLLIGFGYRGNGSSSSHVAPSSSSSVVATAQQPAST